MTSSSCSAREHDAGGLLDDLLVAALARAVAHAGGPRLALAVGDQLHLDVVRVADHRLHEHGAVAERVRGLAARRGQRVLEPVHVVDAADAATAAAGGGLDHQREADALGVLARFLDRLDRPVAPRRDRHAGLLGHQLGLDLVAQRAHHVARRADEDQAHLLDHVRERGVLGHEAPAGPDRVGAGRDQGLLEALVVEVRPGALAVGVDGGGRSEVIGLVGVADEHRAALGLGVERDHADRIVLALGVELADGMDETHRGFAAIHYGETAKRALGHRRHMSHVKAWRCISGGMEFLQPSKWREALEMRSAHPDATALWGGTDVMVELNFARKRPEALLDLTRVDELSRWSADDGWLRIGAGVSYTRVIDELGASLPGLAMASRTVGSPQIRNRGTIGGNLGVLVAGG